MNRLCLLVVFATVVVGCSKSQPPADYPSDAEIKELLGRRRRP